MNQPNFEFAPSEEIRPGPAPIWGWLMLASLIVLLAGMQLQQYLAPTDRDPDAEYAMLDRQIALSVRMRGVGMAMQQASGTDQEANQRQREQFDESLKPTVSQLAMERKESLSALKIYAVLRTELGEPIEPNDLKRLSDGKDKHTRALATIYAPEKLTPEQAKKAIADLKDDWFVWKLAKVHAEEEAKLPSTRQELMAPGKTLVFVGIAGLMVFISLAGMGLWFVYFALRASGRATPIGFGHFEISPVDANANAGRAALILVGLFGGMLVVGALLSSVPGVPESVLTPLSFLIAIVLAFVILRTKFDGASMEPRRIGLFNKDLGKNIAWGIGAFAMEIPLTMMLLLIGQRLFSFLPPPSHPVTIEIANNPSPLTIAMLFLAAAVGAPILEEITFRGTLFPAMTSKMKSLVGAMVLNGFMFAIIHPTGVPAWPALTAVGAMGAFVAYQRGSLVPAIVMHACHNAMIMGLALTL